MNNKFSFVMPAEIVKSEDGDWKIAGLASTNAVDQQGESIMQKGIDLSPIDASKGYFNYDHQKGPENLIGTIDGYSQSDKGLYVHGKLFKDHDRAKSVYQIMNSLGKSERGRVGLSVEGQVLERDPLNPQVIKKCKISKVAVTLNPVNTDTYADLVKSMGSSSEIEFESTKESCSSESEIFKSEATFTVDQVLELAKAMAMDGGYTKAPNELTNGDAMATSSMTSEEPKKKKKKEDGVESAVPKAKLLKMTKSLYKSNMLGILDGLQKLHPDCSRSELWQALQERLETKFPDALFATEE